MKLIICLGLIAVIGSAYTSEYNLIQSSGCQSPEISEETTEEEDATMKECVAELESAIIIGLDRTLHRGHAPTSMVSLRKKREVAISPAERRMTGCILQCVFRKFDALDGDDLPTRRALMDIFTENVTDRAYFTATSLIVDHCYNKVRDFRSHYHGKHALGGQYCDLAYDVFFCVESGLEDYCNGK